ncbi:MAG: HAMP domain-containing histidine kinase [Anaerolineaceae bacterium]|nr:HAMP domain-containing histidine kinase [Anaerolineaceae bacterium]
MDKEFSSDLCNFPEALFETLEQTICSEELTKLDDFLTRWYFLVNPQNGSYQSHKFTQLINSLLLVSCQTCRKHLDTQTAIDLIETLIENFLHISDYLIQLCLRTNDLGISSNLSDSQIILEQFERSKSNFTSIAAHELKTPLTLVEGYSSMLRESINGYPENAHELKLLQGIETGAHRLRSLIDDLIDISLIDNRLLKLSLQPVWLKQIFSLLKSELEKTILERKQVFEIIPFEGYNESFMGDSERLIQVFRNIISNAIKFTPDGGKIYVSGRKLENFVEIKISDTGIGINPEDQMIIFNNYSHLGRASLHSSGKTKFKGGGPGLGLSIAKGIIEALGGAIWVDSPGYDEHLLHGSTFHVILPMHNDTFNEIMQKFLNDSSIENTQKENN